MRTWVYKTCGGKNSTVVAETIEFTSHYVVWRDGLGLIVLAEKVEHVNELSEVGNCGSATRGACPEVKP